MDGVQAVFEAVTICSIIICSIHTFIAHAASAAFAHSKHTLHLQHPSTVAFAAAAAGAAAGSDSVSIAGVQIGCGAGKKQKQKQCITGCEVQLHARDSCFPKQTHGNMVCGLAVSISC